MIFGFDYKTNNNYDRNVKIQNNGYAMKIDIEKNSPEIILTVRGRIDTENSPAFQDSVEKNITEDITNVIFDFNDVGYLASAGIRVIIIAIKKVAEVKGTVKIINCFDNIRNVFDMVGLSSYLDNQKT